MKRGRVTLLSIALAACAALPLTACSGSDSPAPGSGSSTATGKSAPAGDAPKVSAKEVCDYLRGKLPGLKTIGSKEGASANLAGNMFSWYQEHNAIPEGSLIDEQTQAECPVVRTEVLKVIGFESFSTL